MPGTYEMDYAATVDLARRQWDHDEQFRSIASDRYDGHLTIHVGDKVDG